MNDPRTGRPHDLRVDHLVDPLGVGDHSPRLSWRLPDGSREQLARRLVVGDVDSGIVEGAEQLWVPSGMAPASGRRVEWRVKVWTDLGESDWSEPASWEHGLLSEGDWSAEWISPVEDDPTLQVQRPVHQLAGVVEIPGAVVAARLHVTAHGIYEAFIDGQRVGDQELTPGWTAYRRRLQVQTHDVTALVHPGSNQLGALLSDGWWRGQNSITRRTDDYGTTTALLAQLEVTLASGETVTFGTDATWCSTPSHIRGADLIAGEVWDLRRRADWSAWSGWDPVRIEPRGTAELVASVAPPVRRTQELTPVSVTELRPGCWIVDLGQNINGWIRLSRLGSAGDEITLRYGEWLDEHGDVAQEHLLAPAPAELDGTVPFQTDRVVAAGHADEVFEPRHSTRGFQFVAVDGLTVPLTVDDVVGVVVHTDLDRVGSFDCSDERVNAVHRIAEWSFRGNACDLPTDCPTRERAGWTGDWQIYVETASFLYDVGGFSDKWLRDLAADQRPDGRIPNLVPESHPGDDREPSYWDMIEGSAGWGDAAVHVPWVMYEQTGEIGFLERQYESMVAYVEWAAGAAASGRHPDRAARSAEPEPHERFLWDSGWHFGEWLEAGEHLEDTIVAALGADHGPVATAYLHRSATELAEIAGVLGDAEDSARFAELAAATRDAWRTEFLGPDGAITPDTQAGHLRALQFGLVPDVLRGAAAERLVALVREAETKLTTGFLSTPFLLPVLADHGHLDLAYELLLQTEVPGWMVMVDRGATTVWEEWEGVDADGRAHASLNHYSKGAVISFLHRYTAGIRPTAPGYRTFEVHPRPGGGIEWVAAHHDSPYGRIGVEWRQVGGSFSIDVEVPPGAACALVLPDGRREMVPPGRHHRSVARDER